MTYILSDGVYFVEGARNSAICDTRNGNVYSLNSVATAKFRNTEPDPEFVCLLSQLGIIEHGEKFPKMAGTYKTQDRLRFVWFEIATSRCNLRCKHCYLGKKPQKKHKRGGLEYRDWKVLISDAYKLGARKCQFIGGEPFLFASNGKNVLDLCTYASTVGFTEVEIFTNAQSVTSRAALKMKDIGAKMATSVYSVVPEVHDSITGKVGSLRKTLEAINMLMELGVEVRVEVVAMSLNQDTLADTMNFLQSIGVRTRNPDPIRPTGNGMDEYLLLSPEYFKKYGLLSRPEFSARKEAFLSNQKSNSCLVGKLAITDSGIVLPCVFARTEILGNVREQNLEAVFNGEAAARVRSLSKDEILVCRDCEYRYVCHDCRPLSADTYMVKEAFYRYPNPRCTYNPYTGVWGEGRWVMEGFELQYSQIS